MSEKTVYKGFNRHNIAPYAAEKIGVFDSKGALVGLVSISEFKPVYRDRLYRFGLLSDVHEQTSQVSENAADFRNALEVLNNKESVEFTCICGDITQNGMTNGVAEVRQYSTIVSEKSPDTPVYTTTGNHDCNGTVVSTTTGIKDYLETWKAYTNIDARSYTLNWSPSGVSFYFIKTLPSGAKDYFVFLAEQYNSYTSDTYDQQDLTWLTGLLRSWGKGSRVFIFTHMLFNGRAGAFKDRLEASNLLSGSQLTTLTNLCDQYPKTIWFSGHSHWKWGCQDKDTNDTTYKGLYCNIWHEKSTEHGWTVHCPGCANPIDSLASSSEPTGWTRETSSNYSNLASEGAIIDVYENFIDIRGVAFKSYNSPSDFDNGYNLKYLPVATYRIPVPCSDGTEERTVFDIRRNNTTEIKYTNLDTSINYGASFKTDLRGKHGWRITNIAVTMDGQSSSDWVYNVGNIYTIEIPSVTNDIIINVTYEVDPDAGEILSGANFIKVSRNKNNSTNYKAPLTFEVTDEDSFITMDITDASEGWIFTDMTNEALQAGNAASMRISCDEYHYYKVYRKNGSEVEEEITNLNELKSVGFFDSSQFQATNNYSPKFPLNTTFNLGVRYACFDYDAAVEPYYGTDPMFYYGIQFNSSSTFVQANNSSWWPSNMTLCQGNSVSETMFKLRLKIKNLSVTVEAKPDTQDIEEGGE